MNFWQMIERDRLKADISRAEMCRRASISESTVTKGIKRQSKPSSSTRKLLQQVVEAALKEAEGREAAQ